VQLIIESFLTEPPSEISCFRDITLYAKTYIFDDILLLCPTGTRGAYWNWIKQHGAHDFISQLIIEHEKEPGCTIGVSPGSNIVTDRITCNNLNQIINSLIEFRA
jgi:hypothetical protein